MNDAAILLRGPPGAGKSDLALRLIEGGAALVSDDQTELHEIIMDGAAWCVARPPAAIAGMMEIRGLGILRLPYLAEAKVALVVNLAVSPTMVERLPEDATVDLGPFRLPLVTLAPFEASAASKVRLALGVATGDIIRAS